MKTEILSLAILAATASVTAEVGDDRLVAQSVAAKPVRKWVVYILMHSHNDIGYTDVQPNIAKRQAQNVVRALELIRATKDYPPGAQFKWNTEVFWQVDQFYRTATPEQRREFEQAVRAGRIGLDTMYGNLLTGICRGEELIRQLTFATELGRRCGVTVDDMMISDVPGLTWGIVPVLAQAGIKYISDGPNFGDRIGWARVTWEDKPFYWVSPSGREKVLYWAPYMGYAYGHTVDTLPDAVTKLLQHLEETHYPYDLVQMRWSKGDNGSADERVMNQVRDWNRQHAYPKLVIATASEMFHEFEKRYAKVLPEYRGDFTPYWEDGTGSAARETALNRHSADRLVQAETLWALLNPSKFPAADFAAAWKNVALWSEHTWGAYNSVSEPDKDFVKAQWKIKQAFALDADRQSHELLAAALARHGGQAQRGPAPETVTAVDVFNTASWPRTDLVTLPKEMKLAGDRVKDARGQLVPSQRLTTGELVFLASDVPPFAANRFTIEAGASTGGKAKAKGATLSSPAFTAKLDETTGAIASLRSAGLDVELVNGKLNEYLYLPGSNVKGVQSNGPVKISVQEPGPLVSSLRVESDAPGCNKLLREVRLVDGLDHVEIINTVDKKPIRTVEGVHFGFAFNVPNGQMRLNIPWAVIEPEKDQIAGSCKNWFSVERWVDISNPRYGVTWATLDAPLVEVGGLTANLPRTQSNPTAYLEHITPSPTLYSWVMNNHWHTNYKADQDGLTTFRYAIRPHAAYDPIAAHRFGMESSQPLIAAPAAGQPSPASGGQASSRLRVEPSSVIVTALKPSEDGKAWIIRLFGASGKAQKATLIWAKPVPTAIWLSDSSERPRKKSTNRIEVPAYGIVTLRADQPRL